MKSDDRRLAKNIVVGQKQEEERGSIYDTVKEMASSLNIDVEVTKAELK